MGTNVPSSVINFSLMKSWKNDLIFSSAFYPYPIMYLMTITKEFWKNSHFGNMTAGFLPRCKNSLRWEICLICHWNIDSLTQKLSLRYVMVPENLNRYTNNFCNFSLIKSYYNFFQFRFQTDFSNHACDSNSLFLYIPAIENDMTIINSFFQHQFDT